MNLNLHYFCTLLYMPIHTTIHITTQVLQDDWCILCTSPYKVLNNWQNAFGPFLCETSCLSMPYSSCRNSFRCTMGIQHSYGSYNANFSLRSIDSSSLTLPDGLERLSAAMQDENEGSLQLSCESTGNSHTIPPKCMLPLEENVRGPSPSAVVNPWNGKAKTMQGVNNYLLELNNLEHQLLTTSLIKREDSFRCAWKYWLFWKKLIRQIEKNS